MADRERTVTVEANDLGKSWGVILNQALGEIALLQKQAVLLQEHIDLLAGQNEQLDATLGNMRERLRVAEMELLKKEGKEGKEIINSSGE